jgi:hypothetical protein
MCPACAQSTLSPFADLGEAPVECGMTFANAELARQSARGRIRLASCKDCGHVANVDFDPALAHFDAAFEAALFHSPTYTAYAVGVVERLVQRYGLEGKRVLEIASGAPVLLDRLKELGCHPHGVPDATVAEEADFVLARFVLEHHADPVALLGEMRSHATHAFIEVPDAAYDLTTAGWDCIYPHVGYFGASSLTRVLNRAGWRVLEIGRAFNDQYLWAEVEAGESNVDTVSPFYSPRFEEATYIWRESLIGARAIVWGAGTRGTMFCNRTDPEGTRILGVVDRNPAKHGRFLPLAGHRVMSPAELIDLRPDTVVLTNPAYRSEIATELASLGLFPSVMVA